MGCGTSKSLVKRMQDQDDKLKQIMEKNEILQNQITDLKDQRSKRKATYIVNDQEIEDLSIFKNSLDQRFVSLQQHIEQLHYNLRDVSLYETPAKMKQSNNLPINEVDSNEEEKWKKIVDKDSDLVIKEIEVHQLSNIEIEIDLDDKSPYINVQVQCTKSMYIEANVLSNLNSIQEVSNYQQQPSQVQQILEENIEEEQDQADEEEAQKIKKNGEILKPPATRQKNEAEIQQSLKHILEDDNIKQAYEGMRSKMFKDRQSKPQTNEFIQSEQDIVISNQMVEEPGFPKTQQLQKLKGAALPTTKSASKFYTNQNGNQKQQQDSKPTSKKETKKVTKKIFNY